MEEVIDTIERCVELGILPDVKLNRAQIRRRIEEYNELQEQDATLLEEQRQLLSQINFFEQKGLMEVFYPDGYKVKPLRPKKILRGNLKK